MAIPQQPADTSAVVGVAYDDKRIRQALVRALHSENYGVLTAADGLQALKIADQVDIMILDLTMPHLGGLEVCQRLRSMGSDLPILLLTARQETEHRVIGLDSGADDYLAKPFALDELLARIRALLRRNKRSETSIEDPLLRYGDLCLDRQARQAYRNDKLLDLTRTEYELLELFLEHPNQVLTRDQIYEAVWGYDSTLASNSLEVYVGYLRRKTEIDNSDRLIRTVRGVGYVLRSS